MKMMHGPIYIKNSHVWVFKLLAVMLGVVIEMFRMAF